MARALLLPSSAHDSHSSDAAKDGSLMVSEEEALFVQELAWSWLVLGDDEYVVPDEVLKSTSLLGEKRVEEVDWAGLICCMANRELLQGKTLGKCYYASHLQLLLKHQKPQLFGDECENAGFQEMEVGVGDESLLMLECQQMGNREIVPFDEGLWKNGCDGTQENPVDLNQSEDST